MSSPRQPRTRRGTGSEETRGRILDAARALAVEEGYSRFTIERVAERAEVSRLTVYYQFGSKHELLEALFDHLAARGRMERLAEAFQAADPLVGLTRFIEVFCGFWASDPAAILRLRSWAALEPGFEEAGRGRDAWQRQGLETLVQRLRAVHSVPAEHRVEEVVDTLHVLLSPESYEKLTRYGRSEAETVALLNRMARLVLGLGDAPQE